MGIEKALRAIIVILFTLFGENLMLVNGDFNYKDALTKSIIFLEAQRSGKLPSNNRVPWRGDSALDDGKLANVDLSGGYYDAGDNVKFGLPMAFTVTTLSWAALFYKQELQATKELGHVQDAIKWGTDYFLKCSKHKKLYVEVGDPHEDHKCWVRPEKMKTKRTVLMIDNNTPGTEIAAETAAAMAAASIVFRPIDRKYARRLLNRAKLLFQFAKSHKGTYDGECPFYCSYSGYNDELMWAATWLYYATLKPMYMKYIQEDVISASVAEFSWDLKYAGAQILLTQLHFQGHKDLEEFKIHGDSFICSVLPDSPYNQIKLSSGKNPEGRSYMVGFGKNPPKQAHHRGASVPKASKDEVVSCAMSFTKWLNVDSPNPNELTGAIMGGPDKNDKFVDKRTASSYTEPCTYVNSLAVGPLAKLASLG
ncbi:hypothetical protein TanjilG_09860 [Lupinus angustifolius]|uniref:cellulase n=1 Tax=Lupinus angustifolius TaxID=3871 RepID=A0A4P1QWJ6_LUPAN|nr:hypothetical protein TanjilG_09860 [Lupinus angustifolius]